MKLNINKLHYLILILVPIGWVLNFKYYFSRFISEGFEPWLSIIISITLVIFASFCFSTSQFLKNKISKMWIMFFIGYIVLGLYSINCTAAGQYWDQQLKNQETNTVQIDKENTSYLIERYQKKITDLENEYSKLNEIRNNTLDDLSDLYDYKNTTKTVEEMKSEIKKELHEYEIKLEAILKENKISAKNQDSIKMSKTLYIFYAIVFNMQGETPEEKIQFVFQIILSIIIESIAQMAIYAFMKIQFLSEKKPGVIKPIEKYYSPVKITPSKLRHFSVIAWSGINKKQSAAITGKNTFMALIQKVCPGFTENDYKVIMGKAIAEGLIKKEGENFVPGSQFVNQEFFYTKMCKIMNFT